MERMPKRCGGMTYESLSSARNDYHFAKAILVGLPLLTQLMMSSSAFSRFPPAVAPLLFLVEDMQLPSLPMS